MKRREKAEHIQDPYESGFGKNVALCGLIWDPDRMADVRDGVSACEECTHQADLWWAAEDATWD